ncbi:stAR-related lipid transfer protein 13-like isoform X2 [Acipenser ruthenus]|uniref:stAR-related lipid transfer protein 13-like isoform X2 n=1 Tax=Acipenser ruthenus TaxID=7906 RepID=UPI002740FFD7|nr:stAR-related lipid transfer protein 13-like isoform X2 [Acipenser ruthenus]
MDRRNWKTLRPRSLTVHFRDSTYKALGILRRKLNHRQIAELEATEACDWLQAAGFPQYAQLYEDSLFPIDIASVKKDHDFLDRDSLKSLCRRLTILNKCASMKLEVHFQRKQSEDSEEEDLCAISDRWAFQRDSKRWSRLGSFPPPSSHSPEVLHSDMKASASRESVLSDFSDLEGVSVLSSSSSSAGSSGGTSRSQLTMAEPYSSFSSRHLDIPAVSSRSLTENRSSKDLLTLKEMPKKHRSQSFLRKIGSFRRKDKDREAARAKDSNTQGCDLQEGPLQSSMSCTTNESLPGLKQNIPESSQFKRRTKTICRATAGQPASEGSGKQKQKTKSGGIYLEDYEMSLKVPNWTQQLHRPLDLQKDCVVYLPSDHKPGTFPKSLSIESLCPAANENLGNWRSGNMSLEISMCSSSESQGFGRFRPRRNSCSSMGSIYDNVPEAYGSSEDLFNLGAGGICDLDDILQHVHGLQHTIDLWSKRVCPELDDLESELPIDPIFPSSVHFEEQSMSDVGTAASDFDSTGNSLNEAEEMEMRERRDSGVGASLTRPSRKLRWHSFQNSHRPSLTSASLEINRQSAAQLNLLQKFSLLRLTAIMEKYSVPNKQGWSWTVPKFMKRSKVPDYRDKKVFGVPPIINVQRSGQPLPQSIQQAMRYIRSQCLDQVGIFRKSGVKSRIQMLRKMNETSPDHVSYEGQSAYDVADMLKQYFRDLPEPVFTSKLTDTFLQIYQCVPKEQRLQAVQAAVILLPDENREVLQTLLYFLSDIASAQDNQMTPGNLAVCLAPSIFHLNVSKKESTSPRLIHRRGAAGKPDQKDLNENMAATQGLTHMIIECKKLFQIPHDMMLQSRNSYVAADAHPLPLEGLSRSLLGEPRDYRAFLEDSVQGLLRESMEKFKGWITTPGPESTELSYKKAGDGHPIRLWKVSTEIEAPPLTVLHRVLRERHLWDDDLLHGRVIEALDKNTEIYHYVTDSMAPHPRRDFIVLRKWHSDLPKGVCVLVCASVEHDKVQLEGGVRALLLSSRYLIEPCGMGRSRLTHVCRADLRGRSPEWYNKVFGHLCAVEVARIRDSFPVLTARGPETKL